MVELTHSLQTLTGLTAGFALLAMNHTNGVSASIEPK